MKQPLWILNSALLLVFLIGISLSFVFKQKPPTIRKIATATEAPLEETKETINKENIYKYDLFDTYKAKEIIPTKKSLLSPIPEPQIPAAQKPAPPQKPRLLPPLNITLKGTILSAEEQKSISMVSDETGKEGIYHVGDKIKDAQLIKITRNRIVLIRSNGQHETLYLKKDDFKPLILTQTPINEVIKKIDTTHYKLDPKKFADKVESLGLFSEKLDLITAYQKGTPIGIKINNVAEKSIGHALGLQQGDIIKTINNMPTANRKDKITMYDTITRLPKGETISVALNRQGQDKTIEYELTTIEKPLRKEFKPEQVNEKKNEEAFYKMSKLQEREKRIKGFSKRHNVQQEQTINDIRSRLLENMRRREKNVRVR